MKVRVKHYDTEVELELPDHGTEMFEKRDGFSTPKHHSIYKHEDRPASHVAIQMIDEACRAIHAIREGGAE